MGGVKGQIILGQNRVIGEMKVLPLKDFPAPPGIEYRALLWDE